jgi:glycosyltransferase involved in cell wall biosynthesis
VICHNVEPHERVPFGRRLTGLTLRHADIFVTHAPPQRHELAELGLSDVEVVEAFHPRLEATAAAHAPTAEQVRRVRTALGNPELLLVTFGAVRPYKGVDLALEGLARVARELDVRLVVAGRFWAGLHARLVRQAEELGVSDRVAFDDRYIPDEESAALFAAADGVLLPYRAASQSGVVQLAFAHHRPVIATAVGGLPAAVEHGTNGILVAPQPEALAAAIERFADERDALRAGVESTIAGTGFRDYASLLLDAAGRRLGSIAGTPSAPHVTAAVSTQ